MYIQPPKKNFKSNLKTALQKFKNNLNTLKCHELKLKSPRLRLLREKSQGSFKTKTTQVLVNNLPRIPSQQ